MKENAFDPEKYYIVDSFDVLLFVCDAAKSVSETHPEDIS